MVGSGALLRSVTFIRGNGSIISVEQGSGLGRIRSERSPAESLRLG
jgi:hypothetical protein